MSKIKREKSFHVILSRGNNINQMSDTLEIRSSRSFQGHYVPSAIYLVAKCYKVVIIHPRDTKLLLTVALYAP